ncbi:MAG: glycosyltransferase family 2 protein [bacterium]|nr:glycosyltransferase family 2 protein [bacterium]
MKLSVIIPCYNEKDTVLDIARKVIAVEIPAEKEIIVVDDCSTDGSGELIRDALDGLATVIRHERNRGKGAAIRTGLARAAGDYVIIQDADLELDPEDYRLLLEPVRRGIADVVFGTRMINYDYHHTIQGSSADRAVFLASIVLNFTVNLLFTATLTDVMIGYKLIRTDIFRSLDIRSDGFDIEVEIAAKLLRRGHRIHEVPVRYYPRRFDEGKKIGWRDVPRIFWSLLRYRFRG